MKYITTRETIKKLFRKYFFEYTTWGKMVGKKKKCQIIIGKDFRS